MKAVREHFISKEATIRDAVTIIDRGAVQIALVVQENGKLLGTITDGDVRRALLRGTSMDAPAEKIMRREFRSLPATATESEALHLMRREVIHQIPALDLDGRVQHLFLLEELIKPESRPNPVIIMAGGRGRRLGQLTNDCPKPMLPVRGKPILEIILEQCIDAGFREFFFAVNHLKDQIQNHFEDGANWQVNIQYLEEDKPLGTAGALGLLPARPDYPSFVLNGDVLTSVEYRRLLHFHSEHDSAVTLCVREHTTQIPYGVVRMDDVTVQAMEEKPVLSHHVNAGIYLLDPSLLELVPTDQFFDMPQLIEEAIADGHRVTAFPIHEYWLDIGLPETLDRAHQEWQ